MFEEERERQTDRETERQRDRQTDRQTDRQLLWLFFRGVRKFWAHVDLVLGNIAWKDVPFWHKRVLSSSDTVLLFLTGGTSLADALLVRFAQDAGSPFKRARTEDCFLIVALHH